MRQSHHTNADALKQRIPCLAQFTKHVATADAAAAVVVVVVGVVVVDCGGTGGTLRNVIGHHR